MKNQLIINRIRRQGLTWAVLPIVIAAGWIYPPAGFVLFVCMVGAVGLSFSKGRAWCDWMCPRGSFFDIIFFKINNSRPVPNWLRSTKLRLLVLGMVFTAMGTQFYFSWGDIHGMGLAMVRLLTLTTIIGIILALFIHPRSWCHVCPMGTLASWIGKGKEPLRINNKCSECGLCTRACPMGLTPSRDKEAGLLYDSDCIKCSSCAAVCPRKALSFENKTAA